MKKSGIWETTQPGIIIIIIIIITVYCTSGEGQYNHRLDKT